MELQSVKSSNIAAIGHEDDTLAVEFKSGAIYHYQNVSEALFRAVLEAASVGRTLNQLIKSKPNDYPYERVA